MTSSTGSTTPEDLDEPVRSPEEVRNRVRGEAARRELWALDDDDGFPAVLRRAAKHLPEFSADPSFSSIIRAIWRLHGDELPEALKEKYEAVRAEVAWLQDKVEVQGDVTDGGLRELAHLVVSFHSRHRHLASLGSSRGAL